MMSSIALLMQFAAKYIWWKTPDEAILIPERIIAQVMNIGDYADVSLLAKQVSEQELKEILTNAEAGQFNNRSWHYWHYRLGISKLEEVPPLPVRKFA